MRYFEILEDTLVVVRADPFTKSISRRLVQHPKFFFFDVGVLLGTFDVSPDRIGALFEHLVFTQITASAAALDLDIRVSSYRTEHGSEVDFIVEIGWAVWAIELKASRNVAPVALRGLRAFADFHGKRHQALVLYMGDEARQIDGIDVLPWQQGLKTMGL